jgi:hypothetical protein
MHKLKNTNNRPSKYLKDAIKKLNELAVRAHEKGEKDISYNLAIHLKAGHKDMAATNKCFSSINSI